jgi:hypothetical protein
MAKQSASNSSHSAGGPFGGYLYQLEFALLTLFELRPGECLGIETLDDVAKEGPVGQTRYQLKKKRLFVVGLTVWLRKDLRHQLV